MISTKSGRDYNDLQLYGPAAAPPTGEVDPVIVVRAIAYDYLNKDDELAYQVVREELSDGGKTFKQRRPDGRGDWLWSIKGLAPLPYRLPDVIRTVSRGGVVFLCEGEKKADLLNAALRAARLNAVATCNNGGAGHWGTEQSKWLAGAKVCLLPDNDEPGHLHVEKAARHLQPFASSIRLLELPNLSAKGDIADWLTAGHTVDDLRALYHAEREYTPPALPEPIDISKRLPRREPARAGSPRLVAWAQAALTGELEELSKLTDGRYRALAATANRLGTIAAHGLLTETECLTGLAWAIEGNGYAAKPGKRNGAATKEAAFYFRSGLAHPCEDLPDVRDLPALERPDAAIPDDFVAYIPRTEAVWTDGVPVAVRGLMNRYQGNGPLLELVTEGKNAGLIMDDQLLTIECLVFVSKALRRGLTEGVIRTMVRAAADPLAVQFLRKNAQYNTDHRDTTSNDRLEDNCGDFQRNPCGCPGREPGYYQLLPVETILSNLARFINAPLIKEAFPSDSDLIAPIRAEFIAALNRADTDRLFDELEARYGQFIEEQPGYQEAMQQVRAKHRQIMYRLRNPQAAPIPPRLTYKNASQYMSVCLYALIDSQGGRTQYGRAFLCAMAGCRDGLLKTVLDRVNIEMVKHQYAYREIKSLGQFKAVKVGFDKQYKGFPKWLKSSGQEKWIKFGSVKAFKFIQTELAAGAQVCVVYHQANLQVIRRLSRMVIEFMRFLLTLLIGLIAPLVSETSAQQEMFKEPEPEPDEEESVKPAAKAPRPKTKKEGWEERWIKKLANEATAWQIDPDIATNKLTNETAAPTVQLAFDALLSHDIGDEPPPVSAAEDDLLLLELAYWCETDLGGTITKIEATDGAYTPPAPELTEGQPAWSLSQSGQSATPRSSPGSLLRKAS